MTDQGNAFASKRSKYRPLLLFSALLVVALLVVLDVQPYFEYRAKANRIRQLIAIGSDIDDAGPKLKANGFTYFEKDFDLYD